MALGTVMLKDFLASLCFGLVDRQRVFWRTQFFKELIDVSEL
jgi:hypothetical protein